MDSECGDGYLAGVFDGEGYIGMGRMHGGYTLHTTIKMTSLGVLKVCRERFGGSIHAHNLLGHTDGFNRKPQWDWRVTGSKVPFLQTILPYLVEKRTQVELALQYIEEFGDMNGGIKRTSGQKARQQWYYEEFKRLKQVCAGCDEAVLV